MTDATALINRQWCLKSRPEGLISEENFDWVETEVSALGAESVRIRTIYLSLDPAQRSWMRPTRGYRDPVSIGEVMACFGVGVVEESTHPNFEVGEIVTGMLGWQDYAIFSGKATRGLTKSPRIPNLPLHIFLGPLGHIGLTAYWGLLDIGKPQAGETVVVSAAAGATGSLVGQIAKLKGCRVVGIAGTAEKCQWITETLGFDAAINYKTEDVKASLKKHCPDGIDVYFDNVGGEILEAALALINIKARIVACGTISTYNSTEPVPGPSNLGNLITKRARMEGFLVTDYYAQMATAMADLAPWVMGGKLQFRVDVVEGLENTLTAYNRLFDGSKQGKLIVQVAPEPTE